MSEYGVLPEGYVRKPISVTLAEIEAAMMTEFGPGVVQTAVSPLGQLNGLMADLISEIDERNLDIYQSYDPDQAEGTRLETLAKLRLIKRGSLDDAGMRQALTNKGEGRVDIQDLSRALGSIEGVTYARVFVNDSGDNVNEELASGFVAAAVIGGDDDAVANVVRAHVVPGVSTFGNVRLTSVVDGFCRSVSVIRPVEIEVNVRLSVRLQKDKNNCPPPAPAAIASVLSTVWQAERENGKDVTFFTLRSIVESMFPNVEVVGFTATRDGNEETPNQSAQIGFVEIAHLKVVEVETIP